VLIFEHNTIAPYASANSSEGETADGGRKWCEVERSLRVLDGGVVVFSTREGVEARSGESKAKPFGGRQTNITFPASPSSIKWARRAAIVRLRT
jgi:hypothetical protein